MGAANEPVEVIKELRLRRWARMHYVPAEQRGSTWHPIVLDEMRRHDAEQQSEQSQSWTAASSGIYGYVPLIPDSMRMLHRAHVGVPDPQFLQRSAEIEQSLERFIDLR